MQKLLVFLGFLFIGILIFSGGAYSGYRYAQPTTQERLASQQLESNRQVIVGDIITVVGKYSELKDLCEKKYQSALDGNFSQALQVKGRMDAIEADIDSVMSKYKDSSSVN